MTTYQTLNNFSGSENITLSGRIARIGVGAALIAAAFIGQQPLGLLAVLPGVATYPILTAITGWDPLYALVKYLRRHHRSSAIVHTLPNLRQRRADRTVAMPHKTAA